MLIGDTYVGKSSIVRRFANMEFEEQYSPTLLNIFNKRITNNNESFTKYEIWDLAGNEEYNEGIILILSLFILKYIETPPSKSFKRVDYVIIVYDITNAESFKNIEYWIAQLKTNDLDIKYLVIWGNKIDLVTSRVISFEEGYKLALKYNASFIETSAKDSINIDLLFTISSLLINSSN